MISGVETGGLGGSMIWLAPESGAKKFYARKEYYTICGFWKDDE